MKIIKGINNGPFIDPTVGTFVSAFSPSSVIEEQRAAVKHQASNWAFSALLKGTSTCNYGESGDRSGNRATPNCQKHQNEAYFATLLNE